MGLVLAVGSLSFPSTTHPSDTELDADAGAIGQWVEREAYAMGTRLRLRVAAFDRETAIHASEAALRAVGETDELLSTWREGTALAALNGATVDRGVPLPRALLELLEEVDTWSGETGGAFDPAVGALVDAWDLRGEGRTPSAAELKRALRSTGRRCFRLDVPAGRATRTCRNAWLDAGAFGKGLALRRVRQTLQSAGARAALIDFGGQHLTFGLPDSASHWIVDVAHPARRAESMARLRVAEAAVATTGQSERGVDTPDGRVGHVLDPRSGRPVPAWGSVTVVADDPLAADILSTALFVMGPSEGEAWLRGRPDIAALFLVDGPRGLSIRATAAMRPMLEAPAGADAAARPAPPEPLRRSPTAPEIPNH